MDAGERRLLADALRKTMTARSGADLDASLVELGWPHMLAESGDEAVPMVFALLGECGAHAPVLNDVVLHASGRPPGSTAALPYAGGSRVVWERDDRVSPTLDPDLPLRVAGPDEYPPLGAPALAAGRRALAWWLVGTGRAMLASARAHVVDRAQFGRPLSSFQAVRHRLAETLVALDGAEATLRTADDDLGALLAKAAAGHAALTAARHCQQVLGGIGFTAEHDLHRHVRRALVLDGLLGTARESTREAGALVRERGSAPRLARL